jgi:hypothetical protein
MFCTTRYGLCRPKCEIRDDSLSLTKKLHILHIIADKTCFCIIIINHGCSVSNNASNN